MSNTIIGTIKSGDRVIIRDKNDKFLYGQVRRVKEAVWNKVTLVPVINGLEETTVHIDSVIKLQEWTVGYLEEICLTYGIERCNDRDFCDIMVKIAELELQKAERYNAIDVFEMQIDRLEDEVELIDKEVSTLEEMIREKRVEIKS